MQDKVKNKEKYRLKYSSLVFIGEYLKLQTKKKIIFNESQKNKIIGISNTKKYLAYSMNLITNF